MNIVSDLTVKIKFVYKKGQFLPPLELIPNSQYIYCHV